MCPRLVQYPEETTLRAADEMEENLSPTLTMMMVDYGKTRNAIRVCREG